MAKVHAICTSENKGEQKRSVQEVRLVKDHGIEGDAHAGFAHRQLSLLATDAIQIMKDAGLPDLQDGAFGENLIVDGLDINALGLGTRLRLGDEVEIRITQRGKVCHDRCNIYHTVGDCIMPRMGIFAEVLQGGALKAGDAIEILEAVPLSTIQAVVLTISDTCSRGEAEDTAGPACAQLLQEQMGAHLYDTRILPDKESLIADTLKSYASGRGIDLVLAVGGTGFSPRDVTPEAVRQVVDRLTPGLDEAMRAASMEITPRAMLSRAVSGIRRTTLIVSLPGSRKSSTENLQTLLPSLPHGLAKLRGDISPCGDGERHGGRHG